MYTNSAKIAWKFLTFCILLQNPLCLLCFCFFSTLFLTSNYLRPNGINHISITWNSIFHWCSNHVHSFYVVSASWWDAVLAFSIIWKRYLRNFCPSESFTVYHISSSSKIYITLVGILQLDTLHFTFYRVCWMHFLLVAAMKSLRFHQVDVLIDPLCASCKTMSHGILLELLQPKL